MPFLDTLLSQAIESGAFDQERPARFVRGPSVGALLAGAGIASQPLVSGLGGGSAAPAAGVLLTSDNPLLKTAQGVLAEVPGDDEEDFDA